jgi:hypothetical protein
MYFRSGVRGLCAPGPNAAHYGSFVDPAAGPRCPGLVERELLELWAVLDQADPAAEPEALVTRRVLDDSVERHVFADDDLSHFSVLRSLVSLLPPRAAWVGRIRVLSSYRSCAPDLFQQLERYVRSLAWVRLHCRAPRDPCANSGGCP